MSENTKHRLGDPAYVVEPDGTITRTLVDTVHLGGYRLLAVSTFLHFFSYEEAVIAAKAAINERLASDEITRRKERELRERLTELDTPEYRQKIDGLPLADDPGILSLMLDKSERALSPDIEIVRTYFEPGTELWGLVTPSSHYLFTERWRPRPYFIVSGLIVEQATFARYDPKRALYRFANTHYSFDHERLALTEEAARSFMVRLFHEETCGTILAADIPMFSAEDEQSHQRSVHERIKRSVGRLSRQMAD